MMGACRKFGRKALFGATAVMAAVPAGAVDWLPNADGAWTDPINWSSGMVPGLTDAVRIDVGGSTVRTIDYRTATSRVQSITSAENLRVLSGELAVSGAYANTARTQISGVLRLDGLSTLGELAISGGTLAGAGTVNVMDGTPLFGTTRQTGPGTTIYHGPINSPGTTASVFLDGGRRVELRGGVANGGNRITWRLGGASPGGATVHNARGSVYNDTSAVQEFLDDGGGPALFDNAGTYRHNRVRDSRSIGALFTTMVRNTGLFEALSGDIVFSGAVENATATTLNGGAWLVRRVSDSDFGGLLFASLSGLTRLETNAADITLTGAGAELGLRAGTNSDRSGGVAIIDSLHTNAAAGTLRLADGVVYGSQLPVFTNAGLITVDAATFATVTLINRGEIAGHGSVRSAIDFDNSGGILRASGGLLTYGTGFTMRGGTLIIDPGAQLRMTTGALAALPSVAVLDHNGDDLRVLGGQNTLVVTDDYRNSGFGTGDAFDHRANVFLAIFNASSAGQVLSGPGISGGETAIPVLALGNFRVGDTVSALVTISNPGSETMLRGAVKGAGASAFTVTGGDSFAIAPGETHQFMLSGTGGTAGGLANQSIMVVNNFDNVADQTLTITGTGFRTAIAEVTGPVLPLVARVGEVFSGQIRIQNLAVADGFSEALGVTATPGRRGGGIGFGPGSGIIAAGGERLINVNVDTSSAGIKSNSLILGLTSDGAGTSGLAPLVLDGQSVAVSITVNNRAAPVFTRFGEALAFDSEIGGYFLDLGRVRSGRLVSFDGFGVGNLVAGPADDLSGFVDDPAGPFGLDDPFGYAPFNIGLLRAGGISDPFALTFQSSRDGTFTGQFNFFGLGTNLSDPIGEQRFASLFVRLTIDGMQGVIPEPQSWMTMIAGFGLIGGVARRRRARLAAG
jgi:hypothetical protein